MKKHPQNGRWRSYRTHFKPRFRCHYRSIRPVSLLECVAGTTGLTRDLCRDSPAFWGNLLKLGAADGFFQRPETPIVTAIGPLLDPPPLPLRPLPFSSGIWRSSHLMWLRLDAQFTRPRSIATSQLASIRLRTDGDDGRGADTSTQPIPLELAGQKRSAGASCISRAHPMQSGQSIHAAVAAPPRSPVRPSPARSSLSLSFGALARHSRLVISWPTVLEVFQARFAVEIPCPPPSRSPRSNAPASAPHSFCPTAVRCPA